MGGNSLIQAPIFNTKYIVCHNDNNTPYFPSDYYTELLRDNTGAYYSLTDCPQFIVYDSYFCKHFHSSIVPTDQKEQVLHCQSLKT